MNWSARVKFEVRNILRNIPTHGGDFYFFMHVPSPWALEHSYKIHFRPIHAKLTEI